jgi:hypothetical protein
MELPPDGKDGHHVTQLDSQIFDHLDLALLCRLFSECCATALASPSIPATEREALRLRIGKSLTRHLVLGERDPETLKQTALQEAFLPTPVEAGFPGWPSCSWPRALPPPRDISP